MKKNIFFFCFALLCNSTILNPVNEYYTNNLDNRNLTSESCNKLKNGFFYDNFKHYEPSSDAKSDNFFTEDPKALIEFLDRYNHIESPIDEVQKCVPINFNNKALKKELSDEQESISNEKHRPDNLNDLKESYEIISSDDAEVLSDQNMSELNTKDEDFNNNKRDESDSSSLSNAEFPTQLFSLLQETGSIYEKHTNDALKSYIQKCINNDVQHSYAPFFMQRINNLENGINIFDEYKNELHIFRPTSALLYEKDVVKLFKSGVGKLFGSRAGKLKKFLSRAGW